MRLSVCIPMVFRGMPFPEAIEKVAAAGYDAAETWKYAELDPEEVNAVCKKYGVELLAICTSDFNMTDAACHPQWLENLRISCAAAQKLGVKKLITQAGPDTGAPRAQQHANIVSALKAACPILEESGMTLVVEPLNSVTRKETYLSFSDEAFEIIREVSHPQVKLLFDIYHQQMMRENVIGKIRENWELIGHLHVAGCPGRNEPGEEYRQILAAAEAAGYTGICGLEYNPLLPAQESLALTKEILG